jgi:hypothetical protein
MPARTRVFLDALTDKFSGPECRAIEGDVRKAKARVREPRTTSSLMPTR